MPNLDDLLGQVDAERDAIVSLLQDLVRIPSVNTGVMPTGNETAVCDYIRDWLAEDGIDSETLESAPGRGNLIARLEGRSGKAGLMFMAHMDVVPVENESKWRFPPFSATVADGRVHGRGSSDCKALLTAQLMAARLLKRSGIELEDSLILACGADEEHGGRYGMGWVAEHHPAKITAPFAVNEGGGAPVAVPGGLAVIVNLGEKGRLQIEIDVRGKSAHAAMAWDGVNASYGVARVLQRIEGYEPERDTSATIFDHLSTFGIEDKPSPENVDEIIAKLGPGNPSLASALRAASRMTLTPTMIRGGIKSNSVPESIIVTCDVRTLPHQDEEYVRNELTRLLDGIPNVEFEIDYMAVPNSSPYETELMESIKSVTARVVGRDDIQWVPGLCVGFTDSRFSRPLGAVTYGFDGTHPDDDPADRNVHGMNESESIRTLLTSTKTMLALAYDMLVAK